VPRRLERGSRQVRHGISPPGWFGASPRGSAAADDARVPHWAHRRPVWAADTVIRAVVPDQARAAAYRRRGSDDAGDPHRPKGSEAAWQGTGEDSTRPDHPAASRRTGHKAEALTGTTHSKRHSVVAGAGASRFVARGSHTGRADARSPQGSLVRAPAAGGRGGGRVRDPEPGGNRPRPLEPAHPRHTRAGLFG